MHIHAIVGAALDTEHYGNDAYVVYGLFACEQAQGEQGRRNEQEQGIESVLRGRLNRFVRRTKGYPKDGWNADFVTCVSEIELDLTHLHVLGSPSCLPLMSRIL